MTLYRKHIFQSPQKLRDDLRASFDDIHSKKKSFPIPSKRFIWDYWHVEDQYLYFRTMPKLLFGGTLFKNLLHYISVSLFELMGTRQLSTIWCSYYVDNCKQELHSDSSHGGWAFVLNLTLPGHEKRFDGGRTYLLKEGQTEKNIQYYGNEEAFEHVVLNYGELMIFDSSLPHGVEKIKNVLDPQDGRFVIHGWISKAELEIIGFKSEDKSAFKEVIDKSAIFLKKNTFNSGDLVLKAEINKEGRVENCKILSRTREFTSVLFTDKVERELISIISSKVFSANSNSYSVILPINL